MSLFIVELNSAFRNWLEPEMQSYFMKMVELKRKGYAKNYPIHYMPVDTTDFIGSHHLICKEDENGVMVLAGFRTVLLEQCVFYKIPFPAVVITSKAGQGTEKHLQAVMDLVENAMINRTKMIFSGSWTINPEVKSDPELVQVAKDVTTAILYWHQTENDIKDGLALGVVRAKTDVHFCEQGYSPIKHEGQILSTFEVLDVDCKEVRLMHKISFTEKAYLIAVKYRHLWDRKISIGRIYGIDEFDDGMSNAA